MYVIYKAAIFDATVTGTEDGVKSDGPGEVASEDLTFLVARQTGDGSFSLLQHL
jgi:hypothetical protein